MNSFRENVKLFLGNKEEIQSNHLRTRNMKPGRPMEIPGGPHLRMRKAQR